MWIKIVEFNRCFYFLRTNYLFIAHDEIIDTSSKYFLQIECVINRYLYTIQVSYSLLDKHYVNDTNVKIQKN